MRVKYSAKVFSLSVYAAVMFTTKCGAKLNG